MKNEKNAHHKEIRDMSTNVILVADSIASKYLLKPASQIYQYCTNRGTDAYVRAFAKARSQFCLLIMEIISGAAFPASLSFPT